ATKEVDLSLKGDIDLRNSNDVIVKISSTEPVFDTTSSVQSCVRDVQISPVDVTLAPTVQQLEIRGDLFGEAWKMGLKELGTSPAAMIANPLLREFHFCTGDTAGEIFTFGIHARPQPIPAKPRKRGRTR